MDIRIGNDICMQIQTDYLSHVSNYEIVDVKAELICSLHEHHKCCCDCESDFFRSTTYTLRGIGPVQYHTQPFNCVGKKRPHFERVMIKDLEIPMDYSDNTVKVYFKARRQHFCGTYSLVLHIMVKNSGYGIYNKKTYTFDFCDIFNLVKNDAESNTSDTTIDLPNSYQNKISCYIGSGKFSDVFTQDYEDFNHTNRISSKGTVHNPIFKLNTTGGSDGILIRAPFGYTPAIGMSDEQGATIYPQIQYVGTDNIYDYYIIPIIYDRIKILSVDLNYDK